MEYKSARHKAMVGEMEDKFLRDMFAGQAMLGIIIGNSADFCVVGREGAISTARGAYIVADAMLKRRKS